MRYSIMVKATGDNRKLFKFYQENGEDYIVDNIEALTKTYNKLIETTPISLVIPVHLLDVELNTKIEQCQPVPDVDPTPDPDPGP